MAVAKRVSDWWSIEVFDAEALPARRWKDAYQDGLTEAAVTRGALSWEWHEHRYGVVFEVQFSSPEEWDAFRALPAVRSALDSVPDPVNGLLVYRGRGGGSGPRKPRKPRPAPGASSMALPEPEAERVLRLTEALAQEQASVMAGAPEFAERAPRVAAAR
jgi:hypothetical protein